MVREVPKIAFTYWAGNALSYLHLMTLRTVTHFNPAYRCVVYTAKGTQSTDFISYDSHEHKKKMKNTYPMTAIYRMENVDVVEIDFAQVYGVKDSLFHAFLADLIRIKKLEEHGGVWFDMDILFLKPFHKDFTRFVNGKTLRTTSYADTIATGFVSALSGDETLKQISQEVDKYIETSTQSNFDTEGDFKKQYQAFGPDLWRKFHAPHLDGNLRKHPRTEPCPVEMVYPYLWNEVHKYFTPGKSRHGHKTVGIHWYNGSIEARDFINSAMHKMDLGNPQSPIERDLKALGDAGIDIKIPTIADYTTQLRGCNLQGVNLQNADLSGADLRDTNLQSANLEGANLINADLRGANLRSANLRNANLTNVTLTGTLHPSQQNVHVLPTTPERAASPMALDRGISVVIACFNRRYQLLATLQSFARSEHANFEVVIVDDASDEDQRVESFLKVSDYNFPIKLVSVAPNEKTWKNPSSAYNIGFRYATKEVVLIQNAEVMHVGDVLSYVAQHIEPKDWLTLNCYGLNRTDTDRVLEDIDVDVNEIVTKGKQVVGGNTVRSKDPSGWLNHYEKHFVAYHYCGAIYRDALLRTMDGGFSSEFRNLVGGDDDEFVKRLIFNNFNFKISSFDTQTPYTIHLHHEKTKAVNEWTPAHHEKAKLALAKCLLRFNFAPENDIAIAPKSEIPMARRVLI